MEPAPLVIADQRVLQRLARGDLHLRIERGAHGKPAFEQRVLAVFLDDLPAHFLGEVIRREEMRPAATHADAERLLLGFLAIGMRHIAVLDHAIDDPVAPLQGGSLAAERMVIGRPLRQRGEIGGFGNGQFGDRLVEIGQRGAGNAIGIEAEEDLVEISSRIRSFE